MPVTSRLPLLIGVVTLAAVWLGPLPRLATEYFSAHMTMHMSVVAIAAPLIALGVTASHFDAVGRYPLLFSAIPASVVELVVVWAWHTPALHHAARGSTVGLVTEQTMFLVSALFVWIAAFGGEDGRIGSRAGAGIVALLLTSMHMTLLGALIALAPRPLYSHAMTPTGAALDEQHLGGAIMLLVGGASYLAGGLWLSAGLLKARPRGPTASPGTSAT
jgi:putative membrane protein